MPNQMNENQPVLGQHCKKKPSWLFYGSDTAQIKEAVTKKEQRESEWLSIKRNKQAPKDIRRDPEKA